MNFFLISNVVFFYFILLKNGKDKMHKSDIADQKKFHFCSFWTVPSSETASSLFLLSYLAVGDGFDPSGVSGVSG